MSPTDENPAERFLSEEELGTMLAEKLGDAVSRIARTLGAPQAVAVCALGVACKILGEHHFGRERTTALLHEFADALLEEPDDEDEPARPVLN